MLFFVDQWKMGNWFKIIHLYTILAFYSGYRNYTSNKLIFSVSLNMIFPKKTHIVIKIIGIPLSASVFPVLSHILQPLPWHDERFSPTLSIWEQEARVAQELMAVFLFLQESPVFCLTLSAGLFRPRSLMHQT